MKSSALRTRWAAVGAAVAVSLGAGGVGISQAVTESGERAIYAPLDEPCRLADNRPDGIGPEMVETFSGWGMVGDCDLPNGTSGLALNVTAVDATQQTNLRFYPADVATPATANLNPTPGAPPIPNAVNVGLSDTGEFKVFNKFGTVAVIIDVMGVYDDHNHDDRYYQKSEVDAALAAVEAKLPEAGGVRWGDSFNNPPLPLSQGISTVALALNISVPADGFLVVDGFANMVVDSGISVVCWIAMDSTAQPEPFPHGFQYVGGNQVTSWTDSRGMAVTAGDHTLNLVCNQTNGTGNQADLQVGRLTVVYSANEL